MPNLTQEEYLRYGMDDEVQYNGQAIGLSGYRELLENDFRRIPDL